MFCDEGYLISMLQKAKKVLLIEPNYKRQYIPLGLAKIATFVENYGGEVVFAREYLPDGADVVCVTTLFTYDSEKTYDILDDISIGTHSDIFLGGIYATLMPLSITGKYRHLPLRIFQGYSKVLDMVPPNYSIDWGLKEPWDKISSVYTSRGCPNNCSYCAVHKLEPAHWINPVWESHVNNDYSEVMISDNNFSSLPLDHIRYVCDYFSKHNKRVLFNNAVDCRYITDEVAHELAKLKFTGSRGMRVAFDSMKSDQYFQNGVRRLLKAGIKKRYIMAYVMFNYLDRPKDAVYRMKECIRLGIRPYPQPYHPLDILDRRRMYIGKHWTKNLRRAFRNFYLLSGHYESDMDFDEYIWERKTNPVDKYGSKIPITAEDFDCFDFGNKAAS